MELGYTSLVYIDKDKNMAIKFVYAYQIYDVYRREVYWIKRLQKYSWCPRLLFTDDDNFTLGMDYTGDKIRPSNLPSDWKLQIQQILRDLQNEGASHNDMYINNFLTKDGKIYLIDFGWMSLGNDYTCQQGFNKSPKPSIKLIDSEVINRIENSISVYNKLKSKRKIKIPDEPYSIIYEQEKLFMSLQKSFFVDTDFDTSIMRFRNCQEIIKKYNK